MIKFFLPIVGESSSVEKELKTTTTTNAVYQDKTNILFSVWNLHPLFNQHVANKVLNFFLRLLMVWIIFSWICNYVWGSGIVWGFTITHTLYSTELDFLDSQYLNLINMQFLNHVKIWTFNFFIYWRPYNNFVFKAI